MIGIGGFIGSDPYPTLQQFQQYVKDGDIHYFISTGPGGGGMPDPAGAGGVGSQIATWVAAHYTGRSSDGYTVYDLTQPAK